MGVGTGVGVGVGTGEGAGVDPTPPPPPPPLHAARNNSAPNATERFNPERKARFMMICPTDAQPCSYVYAYLQ